MDFSTSQVDIVGSASSDAPFVSPSKESECLSWQAVVDSARLGKLGFADACVHESYPIEASSEVADVDWVNAGSDAWSGIDTATRSRQKSRRIPPRTDIRIEPARAAAKLGHHDTNRFLDRIEHAFQTFTGAASRVAVVVVKTTHSPTEPAAGPAPCHRGSKQPYESNFAVVVVPVVPGSATIDQKRLHSTIQKVVHERNSSAVSVIDPSASQVPGLDSPRVSGSAALPAHAPAKTSSVGEAREAHGAAGSSEAHSGRKAGHAGAAKTSWDAAAELTHRLGKVCKKTTTKGVATGPSIAIAGSDERSTALSSSKAMRVAEAKPVARWKARTSWARSRLFVATVDESEAAGKPTEDSARDGILEESPHEAAAGSQGNAPPIAMQPEVCAAWQDSPCTVDLSTPECVLLALGLVPGYPALRLQAMSAGTPGAAAEAEAAQHTGAASPAAGGQGLLGAFGETASGASFSDSRAGDAQKGGTSKPTASLNFLLSRLQASDSLVWHRACGALALMRKGWTLQDGAVFGTDFMAYDGMPGEVHSTWSVLVVPVGSMMTPGGDAEVALHLPDGYSGADVGILFSKNLHAAAALRGARQAGKRLLLCAVRLCCDKVGDSKAERQKPEVVREAILAGHASFHAVDPA